MRQNIWQNLHSLESRDAVTLWHSELHARELSARRAKEITSAAKQSREFFRNSDASDNSVRPLLSFYGVASLSRALSLLLRAGSGEEALSQGHGLKSLGWSAELSGDLHKGLAALGNLRIKTGAGLFSDLIRETRNRICMHVNSSAVDMSLCYKQPNLGDEFSLMDVLTRLPDLSDELKRSLSSVNCARLNSMTLTENEGFAGTAQRKQFEQFADFYTNRGFDTNHDQNWYQLTSSYDAFNRNPPQFLHAYVKKTFGTIPTLHIVKPFSSGARYSQVAFTYIVSYYTGMLSRYFPTHWVSLLSGEKGDSLWPVISAAQAYVDISFPELVWEIIERNLLEARIR